MLLQLYTLIQLSFSFPLPSIDWPLDSHFAVPPLLFFLLWFHENSVFFVTAKSAAADIRRDISNMMCVVQFSTTHRTAQIVSSRNIGILIVDGLPPHPQRVHPSQLILPPLLHFRSWS